MVQFFVDIFGGFGRIIVFFHIACAALLIGSMFAMRFVVKPVMIEIEEEKIRCEKYLQMFHRYLMFVIVFMVVLVSASLMMTVGLGFEYASPKLYSMIHVKEALWTFIAFNFAYMYIKLRSAKKSFVKSDFFEVYENIRIAINCLVPLNLILALIAVYIGVIIRGY